MEDIQYAFIDEFGDYRFDFDKNDVSSHFMIVSIHVKDSNKDMLEHELERIFEKSSYILQDRTKQDDAQFIPLLNDLKALPFSVYAYVIDKRKIRENSGIMHQTPFIKYLKRLVFDDLRQSFEQLDLVVDHQERKPFLREFKNYITARSIPDLFNYSTFGFNQVQSERLIQLANLIAVILAKGYDTTQLSDHYRSFFKIIKPKIAAINLFPLDYKNFLFDYKFDQQDSRYDAVIIQQAVNLAFKYMEKHQKSEEDEEKLRMDFLKFLLFNLKENPLEYVYTQEILDNLNAIRDVNISQHYFRSSIVSKLRDSGLLIASSSKGYKLPASLNDLYDFVNLSSLTIYPMIQRIAKCREQILQATNKEIDILEQKEYEYLKRIIDLKTMKI
ncbi:DUF3800 domain-containing protein [Bacillus sp. BRMEA1]|uniref:DUF3800 domain-containing protein n=1 Tax=Neobacillus endophyticus TaxID=2738405 RepID=UPI0015649313|nr:DUF3800 domain-containing protein [Neobacillus endophyticus]NRD79799.1 DUF3800 domain-containing protein [Neobacillus endophyticus]